MEAITAESYPEHWKIYENLTNRVNSFISDNPELVRDILKQQNAASHEPTPMPLLPLYFDEMNLALGSYTGKEIKINAKFKDVPLNVYESTLAHEMSHAFLGDTSFADRTPTLALHYEASRNECEANHFSVFFSNDKGQGLIEKHDGTIDEVMDTSLLMKAFRLFEESPIGFIYRSTISLHVDGEKIIEMAEDDHLKTFAPGTILFDNYCNYNPEDITHQSVQLNLRDAPPNKGEDGHSK